jgi:hypothetical protein
MQNLHLCLENAGGVPKQILCGKYPKNQTEEVGKDLLFYGKVREGGRVITGRPGLA